MANLRPLDSSTSGSMGISNSTAFNSIGNSNLFNTSNENHSIISDEEPIYDPVASDDDYEPMPEMIMQVNQMRQKILKLNNSFG